VTERARILKLDHEAPTAHKTPSGYAAVPREVTRREDLSSGGHRVLTGLLGLCYGDERQCRASIRQIMTASGMAERSVKRGLAELLRLELIRRQHKVDRPGGVMTTVILCHPKEFALSNDPCVNWKVKLSPTIVQTRGQLGPTSGQLGPTSGQLGPTRLTDSQADLPLGGDADAPTIAPAPAKNLRPWDPRQQECIDLAIQRWGASNGDCIIGDLLRAYPAELVKAAIDRHFDKVGPGLRPALLRATCEGMLSDGWKPDPEKPPPGPKSGPKTYGVMHGP
jgi:hypothetical protein